MKSSRPGARRSSSLGPVGSSLLVALALTLTVVLGHRQLLEPVTLTTRDHTDSYLRTHLYAQELRHGHWPQSLPEAVRGGGHAFPRYYPPLSQLTAVVAYGITRDVVSATHLAGLTGAVLAALACFFALRFLGAATVTAAISAALYPLLPYSWIALEIRGAFAETWALVFYPLILAGFTVSLQKQRPVWWLPLTVAGALSSHLVMTAWALPVLALLAIYAAGTSFRWRSLRPLALGGLIGAGLMAWFILPVLMEVRTLRAADPVLMRATPEQLAGVAWSFYEDVFRSFAWWNQLEWTLLGLGALGLYQTRGDRDLARRLGWGALIGYATLAILARAPVEIWRLVPQQLRYIQFPERLLGIAGFCLAVTMAMALSWLRGRARPPVVAGLGVFVIAFAAWLGRQALPRSGETGAQVLARLSTDYPDRGLTIVGEYLPRGVEPESLAVAIQRTRDEAGTAALVAWSSNLGEFEATVKLKQPAEVALPLVAYNFHEVTAGGIRVPTGARAGQLTVRLDPGVHQLMVRRRWPAASKVGWLISLLSLGAWTLMAKRRSTTAHYPRAAESNIHPMIHQRAPS